MGVVCEIFRGVAEQAVLVASLAINPAPNAPAEQVCYGAGVVAMSDSPVGSKTSFQLNADGMTTPIATLTRLPDGKNANGMDTVNFHRQMFDPAQRSGNTGVAAPILAAMRTNVSANTTPLTPKR